MRRSSTIMFSTFLIASSFAQVIAANEGDKSEVNEVVLQASKHQEIPENEGKTNSEPILAKAFEPFTAKVTKNKVRLRLQASMDSPIIKELNRGDLLIAVDETDDFYAVKPPADTKAYVFRSYVLDDVVEANHVNVRLEPDTDAPIIGQLSSGDHVKGIISPANNKWLEITIPASSRFFVSKDYIENLGDPSVLVKTEKRRDEVNFLLNTSYINSQTELQKTFPDINLDPVMADFNKVINNYQDFPEQVARAKELLNSIQDKYIQKKIVFLESKARSAQDDWQNKNYQLTEQMKTQQQRLAQLEQQLQKQKGKSSQNLPNPQTPPANPENINDKMALWFPIEEAHYQTWAAANDNRSLDEFYQTEIRDSLIIKGIIEPYTRMIKNKPGDYLLINQTNHLPVAYLYSTHVNLQDKTGQEVTIRVSPRPNNNFAFPAYFVYSLE